MTDTEDFAGATGAALDAFGLGGADCRLVIVGENVTFRVGDPDGDGSYVLRLHRPGYHDLPELDSERVWLAALEQAGIRVPEPVAAPDGRYYVPVPVGPDDIRFAGLTRWRDGEIVADPSAGDDGPGPLAPQLAQLGTLMAAMHEQAIGWTPPAGFVRHRLDADGLLGLDPFWGRFWENDDLSAAQQERLAGARRALHQQLVDHGPPRDRFSMIHADLHLGNLLVDDDGRLSVFDFDDAGWGWHHYDIAVALLHTRDAPDAGDAETAFLDAYRAMRPLADEDLAWITVFEVIRGLALIGWKGQRPEVHWPAARFDALVESTFTGLDRLALP